MQHNHNQYDPEYNRNLIIAFVAISILMGFWYYFYQIPHRKAMIQEHQKQVAEQQLKDKQVELQQELNKPAQAAAVANTPAPTVAVKTRDEVVAGSQRLKIDTPKLHGSINLTGLRFDDIELAKYKETLRSDSKEVVLLSPPNTLEPTFMEFGWYAADKNVKVPDANSQWKVENGDVLDVDKPVTFSWDNGAGLKFLAKISVDENYMFTVAENVQNTSAQDVALFPYGLISQSQISDQKSVANASNVGARAVRDNDLTEIDYDTMRKGSFWHHPFSHEQIAPGTIVNRAPDADYKTLSWLGFTNTYWAKAIVPPQDDKFKVDFIYSPEQTAEKFQVDYIGESKTVAAGKDLNFTTKIFAGAKELKMLDSYRDNQHIQLFDRLIDFRPVQFIRVVDFGWFYMLEHALMSALIYFYKLTGVVGIAIIMLTLCVKLVLFPLARKSYISMGRLKELQPKMKALKEQYGSNKVELNRKTMELYQKEKIHPVSGCLPLLIQMPIFFALYKVFSASIEMRHTPFYGWIHDMSAPDPSSIVNLFGVIPIYLPPQLILLGAWPVLWALTMYAQQKISPPMADPAQAKMMRAVPLVLAIMFSKLPSALVIYYTFNNALTLCQQLYFLKFHSDK